MRCHALPILALILLSNARADEARSVVERAVKEMGLEADPAKRPAIVVKFKFTGPANLKGDGAIHVATNGSRRFDLTGFEGEQKHTALFVLNGEQGFVRSDNELHELSTDEMVVARSAEP